MNIFGCALQQYRYIKFMLKHEKLLKTTIESIKNYFKKILERFWHDFRISLESHKPVSEIYRPTSDNFIDATFSFLISYTSNAVIDVAAMPFSPEKLS